MECECSSVRDCSGLGLQKKQMFPGIGRDETVKLTISTNVSFIFYSKFLGMDLKENGHHTQCIC